jgi:hypothetical protein
MTKATALHLLSEIATPAPAFRLADLRVGDIVTDRTIVRYVNGNLVIIHR